mgnify:FL=1
MNNIKVKSVKHTMKPGTVIPMEQSCGNIGRWAENEIEKGGHRLNKGKGLDLIDLATEIKTRMHSSNSPHTVGASTIKDIISTEWKDSYLRSKLQTQLRIMYDKDVTTCKNVVKSEQIYDFTSPKIQDNLEKAYKNIQNILKNGICDKQTYIRHNDDWMQLEKQSNTSWQFRIPNDIMERMEGISNAECNNLFNWGD